MPSFMIVRLQTSEIKREQKKIEPRAPAKAESSPPAAGATQPKIKIPSAHATQGHLEVLHAQFHDLSTSNLGD